MTTELRCAICTKTWDEHKTIITHDFKHDPRPVSSNEMTQLIDTLRDRNDKLCSDAADKIEQMGKAGDELAHQSIYTPFHERWWQARGGHNSCTVCNPSAVETPKDGLAALIQRHALTREGALALVRQHRFSGESPPLTEETSASVRDSIAPNIHCPVCERWYWADKFDGHKCVAQNGRTEP